MPRKPLVRTNEFPYHIISRSNNRDWFYIPIEDVWRYCCELLEQGKENYGVKIEAFVLMSNHYHLCLYTPKANIDAFMRFFNQNLGRKIAKQSGRINRIFGAPYKWTVITNEAYFNNVLRYVYQNPLRANLCKHCEEYPYSDLLKQKQDAEFISWLNQVQNESEVDKTRKRLRKFEL